MRNDSIALCIPAFNAAEHLPRLFESVKHQASPFDEVWVYDDASADETAAVAERFYARVVRGTINQGCSAGKNELLDRTTCSWVHFHDADDVLAPEFVARAKTRILRDRFDALLFDYEQVDESSGVIMSCSNFGASDLLEDPVRYMVANTVNNGGIYSVPFLRQTGGFDLDRLVRYNEDRAFHLRLAEAGARFAIESYVGCRFYFNAGSMSAANRANCCRANQEITRLFESRNPRKYVSELSRVSWKNAACLASCLDWLAADRCLDFSRRITGRIPVEGSWIFKIFCFVNPYFAIRFREFVIRWLKPRCRKGYPAGSVRKIFLSRSNSGRE